MIISRTPFRIPFLGEGLNSSARYEPCGGSVIGMAIDKYCYISCRELPPFFNHKHRIVYSYVEQVKATSEIQHPAVRHILETFNIEQGLEIHHNGDLPARSGIGSSSAFTVGLIHALKALDGSIISKRDLSDQAIRIEQELLKENVCSEDQILTAYGGLNRISFSAEGSFSVTPILMDKERVAQFQSHLMLFYTGFSSAPADAAQMLRELSDSNKKRLAAINSVAEEAMNMLKNRNVPMEEFGKLLHEQWQCKKAMMGKTKDGQIEEIYSAGMEAGALAGKLLGAGGGGFMLFFARPEHQPEIRERLKRLVNITFRMDNTGSKIVIYEPNNFQ